MKGLFNQAFRGLSKRRRDVLERLLVGMEDTEIARELEISEKTVRSHIRYICDAFGLTKDLSDDRTPRRGDLIELFKRYKPELVKEKEEESRSQFDPNFVGREEAIADLNALIENGAKCIQILSAGGQGKTTLARKFLKTHFAKKDILYFPIGQETKDIASIESLVEERLRRLGEEPGREFMVSLERLRERLTRQPMGVLIDNLEPALDESNRFVAQHRSYVELFKQVLLFPEVRSVTLITSRAPLQESLAIKKYMLKPLNMEAWNQYFQYRKIVTDATVLQEVHRTYNGNALAMEILCSAIQNEEDYANNLAAYWADNKTEDEIYIEDPVLNLIREQFNSLERLKPDAYKLLCRMGCFRYQDVPTVPEEGLFCLLWDVPKSQHKRVVKVLKNRALVDIVEGEYRLHPVVRSEALERLKKSEDWEKSNRLAENFWTDIVETIETIEDANTSFEAYYHCSAIKDYKQAARIICKRRSYKWSQNLASDVSLGATLGGTFIRLGISQQIYQAIITILPNIPEDYFASKLYNILGDIYWVIGNINIAINCHKKSGEIAKQIIKNYCDNLEKTNKYVLEIKVLNILYLYNIGICKIDIGEFEEGIKYLQEVIFKTEKSDLLYSYNVRALLNLASLFASTGKSKEASKLAVKLESEINYVELGVRSTAYRFYHLGKIFQYLEDLDKSLYYYRKAKEYCQTINFSQGIAIALMGFAQINRIQSQWKQSLSFHYESIQFLEKIGSKCDLAEAHYQLALTYQVMNNSESQTHFNKALELWTEIDAPKQIERICTSMNNSSH